jgi:hypothetical protein
VILSVARAPRIAVACLALAAVVAGCGGDGAARDAVGAAPVRYDPRVEPPAAKAGVAPARPTRRTAVAPRVRRAMPRCARAPVMPLRTNSVAFAAVVRSTATAYAMPAGERLARFERLNANGVPTVLGVLGRARCRGEWLRVQLPLRPNGALGWVRAREVELVRVRVRIEVDLSERRVVLLRRGRPLLEARAAIGANDTPTPTGSYYVNQRLVAPDPAGSFGPAAIGISAFSPVLRYWTQGGPIAIHGTNEPHLIGGAVSHGCVRVHNNVLVRLYRLAVPGTPVVIRA